MVPDLLGLFHDHAATEGSWGYGSLGRIRECTAKEMARPKGTPNPPECCPHLAFTQSQMWPQMWSQTCHLRGIPELSRRESPSGAQRELDSQLGMRGAGVRDETLLLWKSGSIPPGWELLV